MRPRHIAFLVFVLLPFLVLVRARDPASAGFLAARNGTGQSDPERLVADGQKLQRAGRLDDARALYEKAAAQKPDLFDAQLALGKALDLQFSYDTARDHLAKAIELARDDERGPALTAMGVSFAFERKPGDAAKYYQRLFDLYMNAKDFTDAGEAADAIGRVYLECGDPVNALKWYETGYETARRQSNLPGPLLQLWQLRWEHAQARIAARRGERAEANVHLEAVKAIAQKSGPNSDQWALYDALEGYVAFYAKNYRAAMAALAKSDQADAFVLAMLGQAYEQAHDPMRARECYQKVMAIVQHHDLQVAFARPLASERLKSLPGR